MEVRQLRCFVAVAENLHFRRAADRLHLSQSAVSAHIAALERELGATLLARTRSSVELTAAGAAVLPKALAALRALAEVRVAAEHASRAACTRLCLGFLSGNNALPISQQVLERLSVDRPDVEVEMRRLDFNDHIGRIEDGTVDAAFVRLPLPRTLATLTLGDEPRVVILPSDHPLTKAASISLADLRGERVAARSEDLPWAWRSFWSVDPRPDGTPVTYGPRADSTEELLTLAGTGRAISFIPAYCEQYYPRPDVAYLPVSDLPPSTLVLAWSRGVSAGPGLAALLVAARAVTGGR